MDPPDLLDSLDHLELREMLVSLEIVAQWDHPVPQETMAPPVNPVSLEGLAPLVMTATLVLRVRWDPLVAPVLLASLAPRDPPEPLEPKELLETKEIRDVTEAPVARERLELLVNPVHKEREVCLDFLVRRERGDP